MISGHFVTCEKQNIRQRYASDSVPKEIMLSAKKFFKKPGGYAVTGRFRFTKQEATTLIIKTISSSLIQTLI
jgi:hypothetical protein